MSDKLNSKHDGAIRLFGALSGVNEKYLAACEDDKGAGGQRGVLLFMRKYGKGMAAVLCLAVLGAGYFVMQTGVKYNESATAMDSATQSMAASDAQFADEAVPEEEPAGEAPESFFEEESTDGVMNNGAASGSSATGSVGQTQGAEREDSVIKDSMVQESDMSEEANKEQNDLNATVEQDFVSSEMTEMTLADAKALEVVGQYIPVDWPAAGGISQVLGSEKVGEEVATVFWTYDDTGDGFVVKIDNLGEELPVWVTEEISENYIVDEEDFTKEYVESQMKKSTGAGSDATAPTGRFGVLYKQTSGYVLVRFDGSGNADEIWELMN